MVSFRKKGQFSQEIYAFLWTTSGQNSQYKVIIRKTLAPLEAIIRSGSPLTSPKRITTRPGV